MKIFRNILFGTFVFFCLFCSCSGEADSGGSAALEKEEIEKELENPDEDEDEDETEDNELENTENISEKAPSAPVFLYCKTVSENEIIFCFSQPVKVVSLYFSPKLNFEVVEEGKEVKVKLAESPGLGLKVEADLQVKDGHGNTVNKQVSFRARNNRVPEIQINELRTEYSKPKVEFIEFKMLSDGNLGTLRVFIAGNYKKPQVYEFAPVEVKAGEYVVLHLRKMDELCKDEYGDSLDESGGSDSCATARDFWVQGSSKLIHKTDAIYVLDQDDKVLDGIMIADTPSSSWSKAYFAEAAELLHKNGVWKSPMGEVCSPAFAVNSSETTPTRSISRNEATGNTHTSADWYVTKTSGVTPGHSNKP